MATERDGLFIANVYVYNALSDLPLDFLFMCDWFTVMFQTKMDMMVKSKRYEQGV